MRILILANSDIGLYKFRKELIEALVKENEVYICVPDGKYIFNMEKLGAQYLPCTLLERHGMNIYTECKLISFYRKIVAEFRPNVVLTYTIKPNIYGGIVCGKMKIPYIVNITGLGTAVENEGILQKMMILLYKLALKKARMVFFQNAENERFMLQRGIVKENYSLIPGSGVNLENFSLLPYPDDTECVRFAFISRIMKEKGIDQYLEAAEKIKSQNSNVEFHVCGFCEKAYEGKLVELNENGTVIYHGMIDDISNFLRNIHCVIHPTYYPEGMSNVLLEACASGRPIITTNRAGCREIVDNGKNGYIIEQKNTLDLVDKINKFIALSYDDKMHMGYMGRNKVEKEFDRKIVVNSYLRELEKICR